MSRHILKCQKCSAYSMKENCPLCKNKALSTKPAKFSPVDPYGHYRRKYRKDDLKI